MKLKKKAVVSVAMCLSLILVGQPVYGETNNNPAKPTTDIVSSQTSEDKQGSIDYKQEAGQDGKVVTDKVINKLNVSRISGKDRYETSVKVSDELQKMSSGLFYHAVVASGDSFPDALTAGTMAAELEIPLLLTKSNKLPDSVNKAMKNYIIQNIYLVGGKNSIVDTMEASIRDTLAIKTKRLAGVDRVDTAFAVYNEINYSKKIIGYGNTAAVYSGKSYTDALAAAPYMYQMNRDQKKYIKPLVPYIKALNYLNIDTIFGGVSSVADTPATKLASRRFSGSNRYKTAIEIAKAYKDVLNRDIDTVILVSADSFPDALSATPLACKKNAAILLTNKDRLNKYTAAYLKEANNIKNVIIVGGQGAVSAEVEKQLGDIER
ncbi:cell wall-binding repeat-containing protein [Peptostreptococcus anaerobius]|uniref:cell wall-binding repeat-containing protein n=1 Tax=Peptostreptococcus TaxID=1257 RepID=UPI001D3B2CFC|nr:MULTISPECIES: cell wall-binding repeat-containing protein [Peptostreptococcus]MBS5596451.1 cell wall-binding repeat-containing protein [Peptostreptococcus sp.]MDB8821954.1 cell wall-binding repeat-containing protein [Peptostreptococcus anaerobius]MDB8826547.1 cell wall-binding repeat-containing protein [Peptostreptococcus anaerobius]MDB8828412.1 cell wall-binding repeat-containing protein [Peptostreptococcus anaerobius]MDB8830250.1 cell wall-binding repeat-containing protein [Peptostreptoco